jgi:hypothetical protein
MEFFLGCHVVSVTASISLFKIIIIIIIIVAFEN